MGCRLTHSDDEDLQADTAPEEPPAHGCVLFVANLPVVPPEKYDKLLTVVRKIYSQIGAIREGVCCTLLSRTAAALLPFPGVLRGAPVCVCLVAVRPQVPAV